jgi:hypothetical protein
MGAIPNMAGATQVVAQSKGSRLSAAKTFRRSKDWTALKTPTGLEEMVK